MPESAQLLQQYRIESPGDIPSTLHFSLDSLDALHETEDVHFWSKVKRKLVTNLLRTFAGTKTFSLMDVGCGNGGLLQKIETDFPAASVAGMDGYPQALVHCSIRTEKARLILLDITKMDALPPRSFDVITVLDVLEHLDAPQDAVRAMAHLLTPHGLVIATVPASRLLWSERDVFLGHRRRYNRKDLRSLFEQQGFEVLHCNYYFLALFLPVLFARKVLAKWKRHSGKDMEERELAVIPFINPLLSLIGTVENWLSLYIPLPFGTSVYCVARIRE